VSAFGENLGGRAVSWAAETASSVPYNIEFCSEETRIYSLCSTLDRCILDEETPGKLFWETNLIAHRQNAVDSQTTGACLEVLHGLAYDLVLCLAAQHQRYECVERVHFTRLVVDPVSKGNKVTRQANHRIEHEEEVHQGLNSKRAG